MLRRSAYRCCGRDSRQGREEENLSRSHCVDNAVDWVRGSTDGQISVSGDCLPDVLELLLESFQPVLL